MLSGGVRSSPDVAPEHHDVRRGPPMQSGRRLHFLDGARGVAAILVVLHHAYGAAPFWPDVIRFSPLRILLTGRPSVLFFFVLSGYVLAYGLWTSSRASDPWLYAVRRIVRIYLPYVAATLVAWLLYRVMQPGEVAHLGGTFNAMWSAPISSMAAIQHLFLAGTPRANSLNVPAWSLVYELRISIIMPLLCALYMGAPLKLLFAAGIVFIGLLSLFSVVGLDATPYYEESLAANASITLYFATLFVAGIALARATIDNAPWMSASPFGLRWALALAASALVLVNRDLAIVPGVVAILYLCVTSALAARVLKHPALLLLGRVSFSLYLTHMIVLEVVLRQTDGLVPSFVSIPVAVLLALLVAGLFYVGVEQPAHALSKRIRRAAGPLVEASRLCPDRFPPISKPPRPSWREDPT